MLTSALASVAVVNHRLSDCFKEVAFLQTRLKLGCLLWGLAVDTCLQVEKKKISLRDQTLGANEVALWTSQGSHLSSNNQPRTVLHDSQFESFHLPLFKEGWKKFCRQPFQHWQSTSLSLEYFCCVQAKQCSQFACSRLQGAESASTPNVGPKLYLEFMSFSFAPLQSSWTSSFLGSV